MTLRAAAALNNITICAGMRNWTVFSGTTGLQTLVETHYNALMPGNAFKWDSTEPTQGVFDFTDTDLFVNWADARGMPTRVHTLVWHNQLPAWVASAVNSGTWQSIINTHIAGVLGHYPGRTWDVEVCDEVFDLASTDPKGYRESLWYDAAGGADYVPYAFERARVAAPDAKLYISDFRLEHRDDQQKRDWFLAGVEDWLSQDIPIDGVSIQSHMNCDETLDRLAFRRFLSDLRGLGLEIAISEFDFRDIDFLGLNDADAFKFIGQYARDYLRLVLSAGVRTVVSWGVAPEDWTGTGTEQIPATPFGASPTFAETSIAGAMRATFPPDPVQQSTRNLVTVVEIEALDY